MDSLVERLLKLDTCAVSDACDRLGLPGSVLGLVPMSPPAKIAGRIVTVKLVNAYGRTAARHLCTGAIEASNAGDVIVIEQRTGIDAASWGGNLSLGAQLRGIAGVIIDGPGRDMDEARQYDFAVFARSHTARTARGRIVETGTNVTIRVGDVPVAPGDYVVADGSGVVFVPAGEIERVLGAAEAIAARERAMVASLRAGMPITEVMGKSYETLLKRGT